jgi:hypothetical protein
VAPPKRAPKTFLQTVQDHHYGYTADELTKALQECIEASERTGKATELTFKLTIKPVSKAQGRYDVLSDVKTKLPTEPREAAIMFVGPNGDLQTKDPRQQEIPGLRVAEGPSAAKRLDDDSNQPGVRVG